ncbi:MAG: hypothetical protein F4213_02465, partial [Boseongicola sp. SB0677_bin_26]|nr:hypothetical protein [Boseongicola sp. SB0665_bin_10]MYG24881.1 hypothetical protein [Boseongicola sp. SB0677_bin_26]
MRNGPELPRDERGITPAWMRRALQAGGADVPELADVSVEDVGVGAGQLAEVLRCRPGWKEGRPGLPASVIVKMPSRNARTRRVCRAMRLYKREYVFYRHIAPSAPVRSPKLICARYDIRRDDFVLVMEDLAGMVSEDILAGADAERAKSALRSIAALHAGHWNRTRRPPLSNVCEVIGTRIRVLLQIAYLKSLPHALDRFGDAFTPGTRRLAQDLAPRAADYLRDLLSGPSSFVHGDSYEPSIVKPSSVAASR